MKYKVGDKVRVKSDLRKYKMYGGMTFVEQMEKYKWMPVTISKVCSEFYLIKEDKDEKWNWTDEMFEGLAEDELTAEEAIRLKIEMCEEMSCSDCGMGKSNNNMGVSCNDFQKKYPERAAKVLKQWKKDHEKKEIETEIVDLIKVMKEVYDDEKCIYAYEIDTNEEDVDEKMNELVRQYYEENGDKIYAKFERLCRVKS